MPLFLAIFTAGPAGLGPNVPARWQHGPTPGVTVHGAWVAQSAIGPSSIEETRSYFLFECDVVQPPAPNPISLYVNYMRPFSKSVEVYQVTDYLPNVKAYEAKDPKMWPPYAQLSAADKVKFVNNVQRYISAPTPSEAIENWLKTPGAAAIGAGGQTAHSMEIQRRLRLED